MTAFIANARMYAVAPEAEAAWRELLARVAADAEVALTYEAYPAPRPLDELWRRADLGCVQMCGFPIALGLADIAPIAAPVPLAEWAGGRAVYRSDLIVRRDAPFRTLADTFGGRAGWTVAHSHSGFNALRHHLLGYRDSARPRLYAEMKGELVTARRVLDCVLEGGIDVGPLDAYWHLLMARYQPELTAGIRVLESTACAPMPAFVASTALPAMARNRLGEAFAAAASRPWFKSFGERLMISGFAAVDQATYAPTLAWDEAAKLADYPLPA